MTETKTCEEYRRKEHARLMNEAQAYRDNKRKKMVPTEVSAIDLIEQIETQKSELTSLREQLRQTEKERDKNLKWREEAVANANRIASERDDYSSRWTDLLNDYDTLQAKLAEAEEKLGWLIAPQSAWEKLHKENDQLQAKVRELEAARNTASAAVNHIASILAGKRASEDSTIHAGNTAFISMERWASEALVALATTQPEEPR